MSAGTTAGLFFAAHILAAADSSDALSTIRTLKTQDVSEFLIVADQIVSDRFHIIDISSLCVKCTRTIPVKGHFELYIA